jgi:hypothetical protein
MKLNGCERRTSKTTNIFITTSVGENTTSVIIGQQVVLKE